MSEKRKRGRPSKPGKKTSVRFLIEHYLRLNELAGEDEPVRRKRSIGVAELLTPGARWVAYKNAQWARDGKFYVTICARDIDGFKEACKVLAKQNRGPRRNLELARRVVEVKRQNSWKQTTAILQADPKTCRSYGAYRYLWKTYKDKFPPAGTPSK